jgi:hypothetical protein
VSQKSRSLRKSTFVNTRIQGRILGRIAAYWFLYHFVLWNGLFLFRYAQYRLAIAGGAEALSFRQLYGQFCADFYPLLVCALAILPAFLWDFVKLSHRIAGPLIGFQSALRELRAGRRVDHVEMRQRDLLNEFQEEFNEFLTYYNARVDARDPEASTADRMSEEDAVTVDQVTREAAESSQNAALAKTIVMTN